MNIPGGARLPSDSAARSVVNPELGELATEKEEAMKTAKNVEEPERSGVGRRFFRGAGTWTDLMGRLRASNMSNIALSLGFRPIHNPVSAGTNSWNHLVAPAGFAK